MVSVESASALITAVSLSATAAALILNAANNNENISLSVYTISATGLIIAAAFLFSLGYLYYAEFGVHFTFLGLLGARRIFVIVSTFAFGGVYVPVALSIIRSDK
jgi:hypothetical protein